MDINYLNVKNKKINLFILGFPKTGTTTLYNWLKKHPDICMSRYKEPGYFAKEKIDNNDIRLFLNHFSHYSNQKFLGIANTHNVIEKGMEKKLNKYNPNAKFIIMTRNKKQLLDAFKDELYFWNVENPKKHGAYKVINEKGLAYFVKKWRKEVSNRLLVIDLEELKESNKLVYKRVLSFLKLRYFEQELTSYNKRKEPRFKFIRRLFVIGKKAPKPLQKFLKSIFPAKLRRVIITLNTKRKKTNNLT